MPFPRILASCWGPAEGGWLEISLPLSLCPRGLMTLPVCPQVSRGRIGRDEDWFLGWGWRAQAGEETAADQQRLDVFLQKSRVEGGWRRGCLTPAPYSLTLEGRRDPFSLSQPLPQDHCPKLACRDRPPAHLQISLGKRIVSHPCKTDTCSLNCLQTLVLLQCVHSLM